MKQLTICLVVAFACLPVLGFINPCEQEYYDCTDAADAQYEGCAEDCIDRYEDDVEICETSPWQNACLRDAFAARQSCLNQCNLEREQENFSCYWSYCPF